MPLSFEDKEIQKPRYDKGVNQPSLFIRITIQLGLAKTEERANQILLLFAIVLFAISIIVFFVYTKKNANTQKVTYKFSKDLVKKLPQNIQVKLLQ